MVIEALLSNETILSNTNNLLQQEISSEAVKRLLTNKTTRIFMDNMV